MDDHSGKPAGTGDGCNGAQVCEKRASSSVSMSAEDKRRNDDAELCELGWFGEGDEGKGEAFIVDSVGTEFCNRESMLSICAFTAGRRIEK